MISVLHRKSLRFLILGLGLGVFWAGMSPGAVLGQEPEDVFVETFDQSENLAPWSFWSRQGDEAAREIVPNGMNGSSCLHIQSRSEEDWFFDSSVQISVKPDESYDYQGFAQVQGKNALAMIGVVMLDKDQNVRKIQYSNEHVSQNDKWYKMSRSFIVPADVSFVRFRVMGFGAGSFRLDDLKITKPLISPDHKGLASGHRVENPVVRIDFDPSGRHFKVTDKRINLSWDFEPVLEGFSFVEVVRKSDARLDFFAVSADAASEYSITVQVAQDMPEILFEIEQKSGGTFTQVEFPPCVSIDTQDQLVVPFGQGLLLPGDIPFKDFPRRLRYGGEWPMPFIGIIRQHAGFLQFVETPLDFELRREQDDKKQIALKNYWLSEKGKFSYPRKIRYRFFDKGGYAAMAKWYRKIAVERKFFETLISKNLTRKTNIPKILGAVDIRYTGDDPAGLARELARQGIKKAIFSNPKDSWDFSKINAAGWISSKDINFQDAELPLTKNELANDPDAHRDLVTDERGDWVRWAAINKGQGVEPGGVICSVPGSELAQKEIPALIRQKKPLSILVVSMTAAPLWECYDPEHPTTRSEDLYNKIRVLKFAASEPKLLIGCEDGVDWAVPYCDYFEGLMSIQMGGFLPQEKDSAEAQAPWTREYFDYNLSEKYRIPLWQLIYGDAVISTWRLSDSSNLVPQFWYRRDLWNILYGTMPLWTIRDKNHWLKNKERFLESYHNVGPVFEKVCVREMLDHIFLTQDNRIQMTKFSGGVFIFVNFGDTDFRLDDRDYLLPAHGFVVYEKGKIWKQGICR